MRAILDAWPGAEILIDGKPPMLELTPQEITAITAASVPAGGYLESIGKTDLATMDEAEWLGFLEVVVTAYIESMAKQHQPFAVLRSEDDPMRPITEDELTH